MKKFPNKTAAISLLVATIFCVYSWWPHLGAKWGIIDDHEIVTHLGTHEYLSFSAVPVKFLESEVGFPGKSLRYRPGYYAAYLMEAAVWGSHPGRWYAFRLFIAIVFFATLLFFLVDYFGIAVGGISWLVVSQHGYWNDIIGRLGTGENYALLGLALFAIGLRALWKWPKKPNYYAVVAIHFGIFLAAGSKENFILMGIPLFMLWRRMRSVRQLNNFEKGGFLFSGAFLLFITAALAIALTRTGQDTYEASLVPSSFLSDFFSNRVTIAWLLAFCFIGVGRYCVQHFPFFKKTRKATFQKIDFLLRIECVLFMIFVWQCVFYRQWPLPWSNCRALPFVLAIELAALFAVHVGLQLAGTYSSNFARWAKYGFVLMLSLYASQRINTHLNASLALRERTGVFSALVDNIKTAARENPSRAIVLRSHDVWNYESIISVARFLAHAGVTNPVVLEIVDYSPDSVPPGLERSLASTLFKMREQGDKLFRARASVSYQGCLSVGISGKADPRCEDFGRIY